MRDLFTYGEPLDSSASSKDGTERWALLREAFEIVEILDLLDEMLEAVLLTVSGTSMVGAI